MAKLSATELAQRIIDWVKQHVAWLQSWHMAGALGAGNDGVSG